MKFIPKTNEMYQFDQEGNVYSLKQNRFLVSSTNSYSIIFEHGRRNIRKQALIEMYKALDMELKQIPNCSNYSISRNGFVYSNITNCEVKMFKDKDGYARTSLVCDDGVRRKFRRCRLVALTYIPNPNNLPLVNHKDENKTHDFVDNLEWATVQENVLYSKAWLKRKRNKNGMFI